MMKSLSECLHIVILLHSIHNVYCWELEPREFTKRFTHQEGPNVSPRNFAYDWKVTADNEVLFNSVQCEQKDNLNICKLTKQSYNFSEPFKIGNKKTCYFKLGKTGTIPLLVRNFASLGDNRLIFEVNYVETRSFSYSLEMMSAIRLIDMDGCKLMRKFDEKVRFPKTSFLPHLDNTGRFDIFYTSHNVCENNTRARITYDKHGRNVEGPVCFLPDKFKDEKVDWIIADKYETFSHEMFFLMDGIGPECRGYLVNYTGTETKELFTTECTLTRKAPDLKVSTKYGRVTYCRSKRNQETANCAITNFSSNAKINFTLTFPHKILAIKLYNLENGDFLILSAHSYKYEDFGRLRNKVEGFEDKQDELILDDDADEGIIYELRRYNESGSEIEKAIEIQNWSCDNLFSAEMDFDEISHNRVCLRFMCNEAFQEEDGYAIDFTFNAKCINL